MQMGANSWQYFVCKFKTLSYCEGEHNLVFEINGLFQKHLWGFWPPHKVMHAHQSVFWGHMVCHNHHNNLIHPMVNVNEEYQMVIIKLFSWKLVMC
jgi:hypothetical protein